MIIQLLILLLIAGICGALGQAIGGYSHGGCLVSLPWDSSAPFWERGWRAPWDSRSSWRSAGGMTPNYLVDYRTGVVCCVIGLIESPARL